MARKTDSLPSLPALMKRAAEFLAGFASWLDALLAPLEGEWAAAPALAPARISETRTRRTTTARLYGRRQISARRVLMMAHPVNHAHKWAARVAKRRDVAPAQGAESAPAQCAVTTPASAIRFPQPPASRRLESALPARSGYAPEYARYAQGGRADLFLRLRAGTGSRRVLMRNLKTPDPVGRHHAVAFTPRPMTA